LADAGHLSISNFFCISDGVFEGINDEFFPLDFGLYVLFGESEFDGVEFACEVITESDDFHV
jgi:hypothetical protein